MADKSTAQSKGRKNIAGRVREAIQPLVEQAGYSLWDVTFGKQAAEWILEVSIDRAGGIGTEDCAVVTRLIDPLLDEMDPIEGSYCLAVSSAGTERELREPAHYAYALERRLPVLLRTFVSVDGRKQFEGTLTQYDEETVTIEESGTERQFAYKQIAKLVAICPEDTGEEESEETPPSLQQSERNGQTS